MKVDNQYPETSRSVSENYFLNFLFLNVDISLTRSDTSLELYLCIKNIAVEGTVSQICYCDNRPPSGWLRGAKPLGPFLGPLTSFPSV